MKLTPLADEPISDPPVNAVHHPIKFPFDVAFKLVNPPHATVSGLAITEVAGGNPATVTVNETLVALLQVIGFQEILATPFPLL